MKLPESNKDRMVFFALIGVVALVVLYVAVQYGVRPILDSKGKLEASKVERKEKLKRAMRELDYAPGIRKEYDEISLQIATLKQENVYRPILGSYLVGVSEQIDAAARSAGVRIEDTREVGVIDLPFKAKDTALKEFKLFAVQVSAYGSYQAITRFLQFMEVRNPFFSITDMTLSGQADQPEEQRLSVRMEWPIENMSPPKEGAL